MSRNLDYTTLAVRHVTRERIKTEAENAGLKMWALVDRMAENYFNHRREI